MASARLWAGAATLLIAAALAGPTQAAPAEASPDAATTLATVEDVAYEQPMDNRGRPVGPRVQVSAAEHAPSADALEAAAAKPSASPSAARGARALQGSGCKTVWATRIGRSLFGFVLWKFTQEKYFCWTYPRVTNVQTNAYACCTDPTWHYRGVIGSAGWFFTWKGNGRGGHYSFRQGRFEQTLSGTVIDSAQPWVKIWVYGDGSWSYQTGA